MTALTTDDGLLVRVAGGDSSDAGSSGGGPEVDSRVTRVGSTGVPGIEPLVAVTEGEETALYTNCTDSRVGEVVSAVTEAGDVAAGGPDAVVSHDPETVTFPTPDLPGFAGTERTVLGGCGWRRPTAVADHDAAGGFPDVEPSTVVEVGRSLRGRGWGDLCHDEFPAETWEQVAHADADPVIVVNAHSAISQAGRRAGSADTLLLDSVPFDVLDGVAALTTLVDAERVVLYAATTDEAAVQTAADAATDHPTLSVPVDVVTGPDEYRGAEPTMAIEAVEGNHRLEARIRPPGPEEVGVFGKPTLVHTPRTLAHLGVSLRGESTHGGESPGDGTATGDSTASGEGDADQADTHTRVVTVTGDVTTPAAVEVPAGASLGAAVDAAGVDDTFKAACVGGQFGGLTRDLDVGVDPSSLSDANLGTEGTVHLLGEDRCIVEFVGQRTTYAADENCGRCVPCREGTTQLASLLRDVYDGSYDRDGIEELTRVMERSSICAFGVQAARPAETALDAFTAEFEAHADGDCPAGSCVESVEVH